MAELYKKAKRGPDKLIGCDFYSAHWPEHGGMREAFRLNFKNPDGVGVAFTATFDRAEAQKIVEHFGRVLRQVTVAVVLALATLPAAGCADLADRLGASFGETNALDFGAFAIKVKPAKAGGHVRVTIRF